MRSGDLRFKTYRFGLDQPENQKHRPGVILISLGLQRARTCGHAVPNFFLPKRRVLPNFPEVISLRQPARPPPGVGRQRRRCVPAWKSPNQPIRSLP